ncbi:hypothetical protein [Cryptosporangium phraense]|uniref:Uncharacterized protein n=1 Tax=Cryptosporangium phraense TaxID=2593070 RepID=A0A545AQM7_9ACTN|nr:hypothetical protein [Cryptosporangium phraense]TQS43583.1 hypothetical protein FL583_18265 [Cryptosporangium phraense]
MSAAKPSLDAAEQAKFFADLIARGEVVEADDVEREARAATKVDPESGEPLPPGVTHEIVRDENDQQPVVKRRRYSAF